MSMRHSVLAVCVAAAGVIVAVAAPRAQSDLDGFMKQVIERRDDNWKKLQQYVLDEREAFDLRGPGGLPLWGERRDYTWFLQDGFFVRSPLKVNGVTVGEAERRKFEADYLKRAQERDRRAQRRERSPASAAGDETNAPAAPAISPADAPDVETFIKQTRQPEFISSAYFLRFKFDEGRYALVGRETLAGREVLRIEYYPQKLFVEDEEERARREERQAQRGRRKERCVGACEDENDKSYNAEMQRLMNKASKVTLWVEPQSHQILKYTFDDLGWDFLPGQWLVRVESVRASMTMSEPFPDVWLPDGLEMNAAMGFAIGTVSVRYTLDYHDYRRAEVTSRIGIPGVR